MSYEPNPIDTSQIELDADIKQLTELLAKNTHEVWARQRMAEGWRFGSQRDDKELTHPGLVAYEDLSESEQDYDRNTAIETIKLILALGYRVVPANDDSAED
ncbi:MAG: Ryanodine receptor Ryr [Planctomycetaceae bacterium]|jgi:hypothetical protein|nr:Ryanodine receptor Ryr [Planctomycetaceae bacterium]MBT6156486.1 Ryanodine receptor Ryr [Planctomycetaceae bacterium]MBT6485436.1 Ryanodine receptor Ryr [Planctomycetaceae bacterium]MBT6497232.1 Ryanodine receptor Ryr [Planctomycetaceae bacterium]